MSESLQEVMLSDRPLFGVQQVERKESMNVFFKEFMHVLAKHVSGSMKDREPVILERSIVRDTADLAFRSTIIPAYPGHPQVENFDNDRDHILDVFIEYTARMSKREAGLESTTEITGGTPIVISVAGVNKKGASAQAPWMIQFEKPSSGANFRNEEFLRKLIKETMKVINVDTDAVVDLVKGDKRILINDTDSLDIAMKVNTNLGNIKPMLGVIASMLNSLVDDIVQEMLNSKEFRLYLSDRIAPQIGPDDFDKAGHKFSLDKFVTGYVTNRLSLEAMAKSLSARMAESHTQGRAKYRERLKARRNLNNASAE